MSIPQGEYGSADSSYLTAVASEGRDMMPRNFVVVNKPMVLVRSISVVEGVSRSPTCSFVSKSESPSDLTEVYDFLKSDRVVISADERKGACHVDESYSAKIAT